MLSFSKKSKLSPFKLLYTVMFHYRISTIQYMKFWRFILRSVVHMIILNARREWSSIETQLTVFNNNFT